MSLEASACLEVDVVSDVVCPWCFIGARSLAAALDVLRDEHSRSGIAFESVVRWHPFLLNPDTAAGGEPYRPFLERKFGGPAAVEAIWQRVREAGQRVGVNFAFEKIVARPNTIDAHRLIHRASQRGAAGPLVDALFVAHFQCGDDIGDRQRLAAIAAGVSGEPVAGLLAYLDSDAGRDAVQDGVGEAARAGVRGVPYFVLNRRMAVSGAQPVDVLVKAMRDVPAR